MQINDVLSLEIIRAYYVNNYSYCPIDEIKV